MSVNQIAGNVVVLFGNLADCEAAIERYITSYREAGQALIEIRENELWREAGAEDFTDYVERRWRDGGRSRAYQLMDAGEFVRRLAVNHPELPPPEHESHVRELCKIPPAKGKDGNRDEDETWKRRCNAWAECLDRAEGSDEITAPFVKGIVSQFYRIGGKPKPKPAKTFGPKDLEDACALICEIADHMNPAQWVDQYGAPDGLLYFSKARQFLADLAEG